MFFDLVNKACKTCSPHDALPLQTIPGMRTTLFASPTAALQTSSSARRLDADHHGHTRHLRGEHDGI